MTGVIQEHEYLKRCRDQPPAPPGTVGKLVYKPYNPARCGKVIQDCGMYRHGKGLLPFRLVEVCWLKGDTTIEEINHLQDFEELVAEHKRKYERHSATIERLRKIEEDV